MINLPDWLPPAVAKEVILIHQTDLRPEGRAILTRLATDVRMRTVWAKLQTRNRHDGSYQYPAVPPAHAPVRSSDDTQALAMGETLDLAYRAARDRRTAGKLEGATEAKKKLLDWVDVLRQVADTAETAVADAAERDPDIPLAGLLQLRNAAAGARFLAVWLESQAALIRDAEDPLTISRERSDPVVQGVQATIAAFLKDQFGTPLYGIAGKIAVVALGVAGSPSAQVGRSRVKRASVLRAPKRPR